MDRRVARGEFGPPDNINFEGYHEALFKLLDEGPKPMFHNVCPLWIKEGLNDPNKKVLFECKQVKEEVFIPAGVKVLVLKTNKTAPTAPDASGVYITEEYGLN